MADITMCKGTACPMKESCYRHIATPNEHRQSYFMTVPIVWLEGGQRLFPACEYYWKVDIDEEFK